jgi:hypothetical protein
VVYFVSGVFRKWVGTHRDGAALADEADDGVVAARAAGGGVDDEEDGLVLDER